MIAYFFQKFWIYCNRSFGRSWSNQCSLVYHNLLAGTSFTGKKKVKTSHHIASRQRKLTQSFTNYGLFESQKTELMTHCLYLPDLKPNDTFLFLIIKNKMRGQRFNNPEEAVETYKYHFFWCATFRVAWMFWKFYNQNLLGICFLKYIIAVLKICL